MELWMAILFLALAIFGIVFVSIKGKCKSLKIASIVILSIVAVLMALYIGATILLVSAID